MWRWFQRAYDKIDSWDYPEEWKPTIQAINDGIPEVLRKAILNYIKSEYDRSETTAKDMVKKTVNKLSEAVSNLG